MRRVVQVSKIFRHMGACNEALLWISRNQCLTFQELWDSCHRSDWKGWVRGMLHFFGVLHNSSTASLEEVGAALLRYYTLRMEPFWVTKYGEHIRITDMEPTHLVNSYELTKRVRGVADYRLEVEMRRRGML